MIDETSIISTYGSIYDDILIHEKQKDSRVNVVFVTLIRFFGGNSFANVFDETRAFADRLGGENTAALNSGGTNLEGAPAHTRFQILSFKTISTMGRPLSRWLYE